MLLLPQVPQTERRVLPRDKRAVVSKKRKIKSLSPLRKRSKRSRCGATDYRRKSRPHSTRIDAGSHNPAKRRNGCGVSSPYLSPSIGFGISGRSARFRWNGPVSGAVQSTAGHPSYFVCRRCLKRGATRRPCRTYKRSSNSNNRSSSGTAGVIARDMCGPRGRSRRCVSGLSSRYHPSGDRNVYQSRNYSRKRSFHHGQSSPSYHYGSRKTDWWSTGTRRSYAASSASKGRNGQRRV